MARTKQVKKMRKAPEGEFDEALALYIEKRGWTPAKRYELFERICVEQVLLPVHVDIFIYILRFLDSHVELSEIHALLMLVKSKAKWRGLLRDIDYSGYQLLVGRMMLFLIGVIGNPSEWEIDNLHGLHGEWPCVLHWMCPHLGDEQKRVVYDMLIEGLRRKERPVHYLLALAGMAIKDSDLGCVYEAFAMTCLRITRASISTLRKLTDVAKQLKLKMVPFRNGSIDEAIECDWDSDRPYQVNKRNELLINCYVKYACFVGGLARCEGKDEMRIIYMTLSMMLEVFQSMTCESEQPVRFLYDDITDLVKVLQEMADFSCKPQIESLSRITRGCEETYDAIYVGDMDQTKEDEAETWKELEQEKQGQPKEADIAVTA